MFHRIIQLLDNVVGFPTAKAQSITVYEMSIRAVARKQAIDKGRAQKNTSS